MSVIIRLLFCLTIVLSLATLALDIPPFRIYTLDVTLIPLVGFLIVFKIVSPGLISVRPWKRIDTIIVLLLFSITLSLFFSEDPSHSIVGYVDWLRIALIFFISKSLTRIVRPSDWRILMWVCGAVLTLVGLLQIVTASKIGLIGNYFGAGTDQGAAATIAGIGTRQRISGTTSNPIVFAIWVTFFSLFIAIDLIYRRHYLWLISVAGLSGLVILATLSRGAIVGFMLSWFLLGILHRHIFNSTRMVAAVVASVLISIPAGLVFIDKIGLVDTMNMLEARVEKQELLGEDSGRVKTIKMGLELLGNSKVFLFGTGPDNMVLAYQNYKQGMVGRRLLGSNSTVRSGVHNVWIKMFVEYGVLSGLLYIWFWITVSRQVVRDWRLNAWSGDARAWIDFWLVFLPPFLLLDSSVYESAMSYHVLIPLFAVLGGYIGRMSLETMVHRRIGSAIWRAESSRGGYFGT